MMRRATGRPVIIAFHGSYHGESTTTAALGAEAAEISRGLRGLVPGFVHVPYPHPYRTPFRDPRPGGSGDAHRRLPARPRPLPRARPGRGRRCDHRAGARLGRLRRSARRLLAGARRALPRARLAAVRRRGQDGDGPRGHAVRGRALGRRAGPDLPRQGAGRRRDADRRPARHRARAWQLRRRADRQHLGLAAGCVRGGAGDARALRARAGAGERARARALSRPPGSTSCASASNASATSAPSAASMAIEFVRDRDTRGARSRASGGGRGRDAAPRRDRRFLDAPRSTSSPRW